MVTLLGDKVAIRRGYNNNTVSWKEAFYNFNDSISKKELVKKKEGFFVSHNAERISLVQDVLNDLECRIAHLYIGIDVTNPGFKNHVDDVNIWFWQNKGTSRWDFTNGDSYTLYEGDLLYIPKGVYHKVSSVEARFGISMNQETPGRQEMKGVKGYELKAELLQPWSVPIFKTTLPPDILQTMIEISDQIIADKEAKTWGHKLAGQIDTELAIEHDILQKTKVMDFFLKTVREFVIQCKLQQNPNNRDETQQKEWLIKMLSCWIVSQQPGEYNPMHIHTECQVSSVMYLKVPKMLPSRKKHRPDDGSILFVSNASRDLNFSEPAYMTLPKPGDFYIFGAYQQHAVYPYRCEEGQKDVERRSISFNATFQSNDKL